MNKLTAERVRALRKTLGLSKKEFGRMVWAALTTVEQWESGECRPVGMHQRLLALLEKGSGNPVIRSELRGMRSSDPMFVLYLFLQPLYENRSERGAGNRDRDEA